MGRWWPASAIVFGLLGAAVVAPSEPAVRPLTVAIGPRQEPFQRVFNPFRNDSRWPSQTALYEPLLIYNPISASYTPWLATSFAWEDGNTRLRFALREGVQWSDGKPFGAADVAFTFRLMRDHPSLDAHRVWDFLSEVVTPAERVVDFIFRGRYTPGIYPIGRHAIVPRHIWSEIADPVTFANPDPVATGPFVEVRSFGPELYELARNPRYWRAGHPLAPALRVPLLTSNAAIQAALERAEVDWASVFIPDVERAYVARDPRHREYWYPDAGQHVMLYLNTRREPYDDSRVRKALSLAIDRPRIVKQAIGGYTTPADVTGLPTGQQRWKDAQALSSEDWTRFDPVRAAALLDAAGCRLGPNGLRTLPGGAVWRVEIGVVKGWSDWEQAATILVENFAAVGVKAEVDRQDFRQWLERLERGRFEASIGIALRGPTPYQFYRALMSPALARPIGQPTSANYHRYASPAADELLRQMEAVSDVPQLLQLSGQLQRLFVAEAPALPLHTNPAWGVFNTTHYQGFPTARHPYAVPNPTVPESLPVLIEARPRP